MRYSGVIVARDRVEYGYAVAGEGAVFRFVVAHVIGRGVRVIAARPAEIGEEQVEQFADAHHAAARRMSDRGNIVRYMDDVLAYVRSLPRGCRSEQLFSGDEAGRAVSEEQVREGLLKALPEQDGFRAAMAFEAGTPFLRADRRAVDLMDRIVEDASRAYAEGEVEFLDRVALAMQNKVVRTSSFLRDQVEMVKTCIGAAAAPTMR